MAKSVAEYIKELSKPNVNRRILVEHAKSFLSFEDLLKFSQRLPGTFQSLLWKNSYFPANYKDFVLKEPYSTVSLEKELNWLTILFTHYSPKINLFIEKKQLFEKELLLGNYTKCIDILNFMDNNICYSYWGMEHRFLVTQLKDGIVANYDLRQDLWQHTNNPIYYNLITFFNYKAELEYSLSSYKNSLQSFKKIFKVSGLYADYFDYKLAYFDLSFSDMLNIISVENNSSLIDLYILYRDILCLVFSQQINSIPLNVYDNLKFIMGSIKDISLEKIRIIYEVENDIPIHSINEDITINEIIDLYTKGDYEIVLEKCYELLLKTPSSFELSELYIKALLHLEKDYIPIEQKDSLQNRGLERFYDFLQKEEKYGESISDILILCNSFNNTDWAKQLYFKLHSYNNDSITVDRLCYSYSPYNTSWDYKVFGVNSQMEDYLNQLSSSETKLFFKSILSDNSNNQTSVPSYRYAFYKSEFLSSNNEIDNASQLISPFIADKIPQYLKEQIYRRLYNNYFILGEYERAISLYVEGYLKNENFVFQIDTSNLLDTLEKNNFNNIEYDLNVNIFLKEANAKDYIRYIAYSNFMQSLGLTKPSQIDISTMENKEKILYFLFYAADRKVLSKAVRYFKNSNEVLHERVLICQKLFHIKKDDIYIQEITNLTQELNIKARIKEVDQSKIYVDESGIINSETSEIEKAFNRYKLVSSIKDIDEIDYIDPSTDALRKYYEGKIDYEAFHQAQKKIDFKYLLFMQIYEDIRDKFLFSNRNGLDYYLSTRIRHGTIINQLRKQFQANSLVTNRKSEEDDSYTLDEYWSVRVLNLDLDKKAKLQERLATFSATIDKPIFQLKNELIQIKTEKPETVTTGVFDFTLQYTGYTLESYYFAKFQYISDFKEFIAEIFDFLWFFTEEGLNYLRHLISNDLKNLFTQELNSLEKDVRDIIVNNKNSHKLLTAIANCRTNMQADIDIVERWFNRKISTELDFSINDAVETSIEIINNINGRFFVDISKQIECDLIFKGIYFNHFVDLFKIFITNIVDYYKYSNQCQGHLSITTEDTSLYFEIRNPLQDNENKNHLLSIIDKKKSELADISYNTIIRKEGNTGMIKACNIIKYAFRDSGNIFDLFIDNNEFVVKGKINYKKMIL